MDTGAILTIVGTNVAMMAFIAGFILWAVNKLDGDIKSLSNELKEDNRKRDQISMQTNARMDGVYNVLLKRTENLKG